MLGRRLDSPIDSLIKLTDASGRVLAWNDDRPDRSAGLVPHHADSYVRVELPADGAYFVHVMDAQTRGGPEFAYRLRIGPPRPDFQVVVTPSCLNVPAGATVSVTVHAIRKDGFEGGIELALKDAPGAFRLGGAWIPAGRDRIRVTLTAPPKPARGPVPLEIYGLAVVGEQTVSRKAVAAEYMMQAFGLRHLVTTKELLVNVRKSRGARRPSRVASRGPVRVPVGGTGIARIAIPGLPKIDSLHFQLDEPPPGVAIVTVRPSPGGLEIVVSVETGKAEPGYADNLIVDVYAEIVPRGKDKQGKAQQKRRWFVGTLPAVPMVVIER